MQHSKISNWLFETAVSNNFYLKNCILLQTALIPLSRTNGINANKKDSARDKNIRSQTVFYFNITGIVFV